MPYHTTAYREISGKPTVELIPADSGPFKNPKKGSKGAKAAGHRFEAKVGKALQKLIVDGIFPGKIGSGLWLRFTDNNGPGWAQPDHFIVQDAQTLLFEVKLTATDVAWNQMEKLYVPLLEVLFSRPVHCIQVCKNLKPGIDARAGIEFNLRHAAHGKLIQLGDF